MASQEEQELQQQDEEYQQQQELKRFDQEVLSSQIDEMKSAQLQLYQSYEDNIKQHTDRLSERDLSEFREFLEMLKKENLEKVKQFFQKTTETKGESFNYYDSDTTQQFDSLIADRDELFQALTEEFESNKLQDERNMEEWAHKEIVKGYTKQVSQQETSIKKQSQMLLLMEKVISVNFQLIYEHYLPVQHISLLMKLKSQRVLKRTSSPSIKVQFSREYSNIIFVFFSDYIDIINTLKSEIQKTDDLITQKTEQKAQLAYTISKNLMKTISSLSHEVINLNQVAVQAQESKQNDIISTQRYIAEMNQFISQKYTEIKILKKTYTEEVEEQQKDNRRQVSNVVFQKHLSSAFDD